MPAMRQSGRHHRGVPGGTARDHPGTSLGRSLRGERQATVCVYGRVTRSRSPGTVDDRSARRRLLPRAQLDCTHDCRRRHGARTGNAHRLRRPVPHRGRRGGASRRPPEVRGRDLRPRNPCAATGLGGREDSVAVGARVGPWPSPATGARTPCRVAELGRVDDGRPVRSSPLRSGRAARPRTSGR